MAILLEAIDGPGVGRAITLRPGRPRIIKVVKHGHEAGEITIELNDDGCTVTNRSQRPLLVNGAACVRSRLVHGDTVTLGKDAFRLVDEAALVAETGGSESNAGSDSGYHPSPELVAAQHESAEADRQRRRKSISASMPAVANQPRSTLISRMSSVFSARVRAERNREEELHRERLELLAEAGRQALSGQALGLPERVLADLLAGRTVTIAADEVARGALERWRDLAQRVALIDAEIAGIRRQLGLAPEPGARARSLTTRGGLREREERVFASLDSMITQELAAETASSLTPVPGTVATIEDRRSAPAKSRASLAGRRGRS
jgi:hypothetical protein